MKKALVFVEGKNAELKKSSQEILSLLLDSEVEVNTCSLGSDSEADGGLVGVWGSKKHFFNTSDAFKNYNPEAYQKFLFSVCEQVKPDLIFASSGMLGRDVFPRLAAQMGCAYMSDITEISLKPELEVRKPLYAGKCTAQVTFTDESAKILLIRPNQIPVVAPNKSESTEKVSVDIGSLSGKITTVSVETGESEKLDLTEAEVIVSGGRGLKEADNFKILHDLAEPLGATVGASRAVVDLGWVPHSLQVGQTGKTVAPTLYIAVGISGAIQHLAGMSGSKNIVAINKDEKAPIFQKATYGIVGDLFEVVPLLTEKLKSVKN